MVNKCTSHMRVAHRHRPNSQQQLYKVTNARRPTCLPFETMQNGDNYVKDGLLMPPERPWIDSCTAASCRPRLVGDRRPLCHPRK